MILVDHYIRMAVYDEWANRLVLESLQPLRNEPSHAVFSLLGHITLAPEIWLRRIRNESLDGITVFQDLSYDDCASRIGSCADKIHEFCSQLTPEILTHNIQYRNFAGVEYTNTIAEILTHMFNHGTYHRGQIATRLREAGYTPAITDYIAFSRQ